MVRMRTDLPVPEPPTTPMTSPRVTAKSRPSCTTWRPNWFFRPVTRITVGSWVAAPGRRGDHAQIPSTEKKTASTPSRTITSEIDSTTERVV